MTTPPAIESHVAAVRRKMILQRFVRRFALTLLVLGAAVWGVALVLRLFAMHLPGGPWVWIGGGVAVAAVAAYLLALRNAPTKHDAAVAIDDRLGLKEKFSTALAFAGSDDPFATLAVADAGRAAGKVDLRRKFPLAWPKLYYGVPAWALLILLTLWLVPALDLSRDAQANAETTAHIDQKAQAEVEQTVKNAMDALAILPPEVAERQELRTAKDQLAKAATRRAATRPGRGRPRRRPRRSWPTRSRSRSSAARSTPRPRRTPRRSATSPRRPRSRGRSPTPIERWPTRTSSRRSRIWRRPSTTSTR